MNWRYSYVEILVDDLTGDKLLYCRNNYAKTYLENTSGIQDTITVEALINHTPSRALNALPRTRNQKIVTYSCRLLRLLVESPQVDTLI